MQFLKVNTLKVGVLLDLIVTLHSNSVLWGVFEELVNQVSCVFIEGSWHLEISLEDLLKHLVITFALEGSVT